LISSTLAGSVLPLEYLSENSKKFKTLPGIVYNYFSYLS